MEPVDLGWEITEDHLRIARLIARKMVTNGKLDHVGVDEVISQSYVAMWELALAYDPETNVPFEVYLRSNLRFRLIDWLRKEFGRLDAKYGAEKASARKQTYSLNDMLEGDDDGDYDVRLIDSSPSVEEQVLSRDELTRLGKHLNTVCARDRSLLLWPITDATVASTMDEFGLKKPAAARFRWLAKEAAGQAIDRPVIRQTYKKHANSNSATA